MNKQVWVLLTLFAVSLNLGMARDKSQYDEEARRQEQFQKEIQEANKVPTKREPLKNFATGVKQLTVDNVEDALGDTAEGTITEKPIVGTLDGAEKGSSKVVDNTIKGVKKVVSLGYSTDDSYEIEEAEKGSGDAAKIRLFQF